MMLTQMNASPTMEQLYSGGTIWWQNCLVRVTLHLPVLLINEANHAYEDNILWSVNEQFLVLFGKNRIFHENVMKFFCLFVCFKLGSRPSVQAL